MGHSVRACIIGMRIAQEWRLPAQESAELYYTLLLKDAGCSSNSSRLYHILNADDLRAKGDLKVVDWTKTGWESLQYALTHVATHMPYPEKIWKLLAVAATQQRDSCELVKIRCERGATIARNPAIDAVRFAGGLGYAVNSRLSLGVTVGAVYNTNTYDAPYIFQTQPALAGLKTLLDMHTSGVGWNASAGALFQATRKVQVGLAWKSRTEINTSGNASGDAYAQFAALGINAPSSFTYNAKVQNVLPESILANVAWQATPKWLFAFQSDWINWKDSFVVLPVTMTNGTNAVINSVVGGTSFSDGIPLHWKDQYGFHVGVERRLLESTVVRFGFAHANSPVPDSTLTPLDGAILTNEISVGLGYTRGNSRIDVSYDFRPENTQQVGQSALLAGEYNNSSVSVGTQSLALGYSYHF